MGTRNRDTNERRRKKGIDTEIILQVNQCLDRNSWGLGAGVRFEAINIETDNLIRWFSMNACLNSKGKLTDVWKICFIDNSALATSGNKF